MLIDIQTRIKPIFRHVGGAVNVRNAIEQPIRQHSVAFVVPISENPVGNSRDVDVGQPLQEMTVTFGVVMGLKSVNDATGEKALTELKALRDNLRKQLYGWTPPGDYEPILLGKGDLVGFAADGLWWLDRFVTTTWYEGEND